MAQPMMQRKRSSINLNEKVTVKPVVKRQRSERTLVAEKIEKCLLLGNASPRVMTEVPSLSPKQELSHDKYLDDSFFLDNALFDKKDSQTKEQKCDIERERSSEPEVDDFGLSEEAENEVVSFDQATVGDATKKICQESQKNVENEGEDEPDGHHGQGGLKGFLDRVAHRVEDVAEGLVDFVMPHHDLPRQEQIDYHDLEGFTVHLPAHFHPFDSPCPFGARLNRSENGYKLARVLTDTAAHHAGLKESDEVTHLNDIELKSLDTVDLQKLFMTIDTTFTLTILRRYVEGNTVHLKKTTIRVTVADEIVVEVVRSEIVWSRKPRHVSTSALSYVSQDGDGNSQIYLNKQGEMVTMGTLVDERAQFFLDFYAVIGFTEGQRCVIRHGSTNQLYDAVQNCMKTVKDIFNPEQSFMLDKIKRSSNHTFVFESVERPGHYLIYQVPDDRTSAMSSGTFKLSQCISPQTVPSQGSFKIYDVKDLSTSSSSRRGL
ncbi:uncharacterized protein LOC121429914 [Lytechinus variegatus]|uniref:uncharacterized protein LOC121429914 n=1 Tax=Lytechinus variegatus TaxID=7654 RepID=UPI001BB1E52D|nr:uncharacterized protein LOC121429914 [Lytechinus variegatus]